MTGRFKPVEAALPDQVWSRRFTASRQVERLQRLFNEEVGGGVLMLVALALAMLWANLSPDTYQSAWERRFVVGAPDLLLVDLTLREWVNDGLMVLFFFHAALEIRREATIGDLSHPRTALMPVAGAVGGILLPAGLYLAVNAGTPTWEGWGIPVGTDTALAIGAVTLLGTRLPRAAKTFLLALVVVDDVGVILVIALFYTSDLDLGWLSAAMVTIAIAAVSQRAGIRSRGFYLAWGILCWIALHESGVHPIVTGVAFALLTPVWSYLDPRRVELESDLLLDSINTAAPLTEDRYESTQEVLQNLDRLTEQSRSPLDRVQRAIHPWVTYGVVPMFALANGGIELSASDLMEALTSRLGLGIIIGLVVGKTLGILGACRLVTALIGGQLPGGLSFRHLTVVAATGGIGFTMAMLVADLTFTGPELDRAKFAVLIASTLSAALAVAVARLWLTKPDRVDLPHVGRAVSEAARGGTKKQE